MYVGDIYQNWGQNFDLSSWIKLKFLQIRSKKTSVLGQLEVLHHFQDENSNLKLNNKLHYYNFNISTGKSFWNILFDLAWLAWEPSFAWKLNFRYKTNPRNSESIISAKNIPVVLPSSNIPKYFWKIFQEVHELWLDISQTNTQREITTLGWPKKTRIRIF